MEVTPARERRHRVRLENPGTPTPDGDGGFTSTWTALSPAVVSAKIEEATAAGLERITSGTVTSAASHILKFPYHSGVTTKTRALFGTRVLQVTGVSNPEERNIETIAFCVEVVA